LLDEGNESPGRECRVVLGFDMGSGVVYHGAMIRRISVDGNHPIDGNHPYSEGKGAVARRADPSRKASQEESVRMLAGLLMQSKADHRVGWRFASL
jgi:hypothetical protein